MDKTQSQTGDIAIKKEEEEDYKHLLSLHNNNNTPISNKITKRNAYRENSRQLPDQHVKIEEDIDTKSLLQSALKYSKLPKGRCVSQEQINQLIDYVVNHGMNITEASRKVKIGRTTGDKYYNLYKNDPDKKIPLVRSPSVHHTTYSTKQQVESLIKYVNCDGITIKEASKKANMSCRSGYYYYNRYLKDPNHNIPIPLSVRPYTQDQKNELVGYIVNDKMSIYAASKKANMSWPTGKKYYQKCLKDQKRGPLSRRFRVDSRSQE